MGNCHKHKAKLEFIRILEIILRIHFHRRKIYTKNALPLKNPIEKFKQIINIQNQNLISKILTNRIKYSLYQI